MVREVSSCPLFVLHCKDLPYMGKKRVMANTMALVGLFSILLGAAWLEMLSSQKRAPLIAGTTSKIAPIAFGERAYYTSSNEDLCSFVASCGCQFGWQGSPDCEYAYPVFRTGHGRRACYAWLPDPRTVSQNVPRHHILDRCRILEKANQPWVQRPMGSTWTAQKGGL